MRNPKHTSTCVPTCGVCVRVRVKNTTQNAQFQKNIRWRWYPTIHETWDLLVGSPDRTSTLRQLEYRTILVQWDILELTCVQVWIFKAITSYKNTKDQTVSKFSSQKPFSVYGQFPPVTIRIKWVEDTIMKKVQGQLNWCFRGQTEISTKCVHENMHIYI